MAFAQLTYRESLRDIEACLRAQAGKLYHMGIKRPGDRAVLWPMPTRAATGASTPTLPSRSSPSPVVFMPRIFGVDLKETVYALDASTIDLCLSVFPWAPFRSTKAAIKLHTLLDLRGNIPSFHPHQRWQTARRQRSGLLLPEPGAFYIMDRGYIDFERLYRLHEAKSFFVTRAKSNLKAQRRYSHPVDRSTGLICDQTIVLTGFYSQQDLSDTPCVASDIKDPEPASGWCFSPTISLAGVHHHRALSLPVASRVVFQMDQAASSYQSLLRHLRERRQNPNLDCRLGLRARRHRQKATQPIGDLV